ncbi:subclass B3 metallo-beta-lactamase BJP-1 [soil metagenome]
MCCIRRTRVTSLALAAAMSVSAALPSGAQVTDTTRARACPSCVEWNAPQSPMRIFGNTYYVGTHGLGAILITSQEGHVLIDAGLPESAAPVLASIRTLGFKVEDIRLILNSHAHYDHAGGIADVQRVSHATVAASAWSAGVIVRGTSPASDPQYSIVLPFPPARDVQVIADGETLRVGPLTLTAHFTGGHTPGGTTWTWRSCEGGRCLNMVYADSQTPVSADDFLFTRNTTYPAAVSDFEHGQITLEHLACDVLLTPHPGASSLFERLAARDAGAPSPALVDSGACQRLAATARDALARRIATEKAKQ